MRWLLCKLGFHQFYANTMKCKYTDGVYYYSNKCIWCRKEYTCEIEEKFFFKKTEKL